MSNNVKFDYYYGLESEQFSFFRIPKLLLEDNVFHELSDRARILYGILMDRMSLSRANHWLDDMNRVYIIFSIDEIEKALNCSRPTACKALAELDSDNGIGLVERIRRGQGKPDIIYVKNFISYVESNTEIGQEKTWDSSEVMTNEEPSNTDESSEVKNLYFKKLNNFTSRSKKTLPQEVKDFYPNNTNINNTDLNNTLIDKIDRVACVSDTIKQNIEYDYLMQSFDPDDIKVYQELYELICDVVLFSKEYVRINGSDYPHEMVKDRFMKIRREHIEYVVRSLDNTFTDVKNMRGYLLTALYNATSTIQISFEQDIRNMTKNNYK